MTDREHLYSCETCCAPIYEGDQACRFFTEVTFCSEHAVKHSDALAMLQEAVKGGYSPYEGEDYDEAEMMDRIAKLELKIAVEGDGPARMVTL